MPRVDEPGYRGEPAELSTSSRRPVPVSASSSTGRSTPAGAGGSSSSISRRSSGGGTAGVGRPRSFPAISGPIPEITDGRARPVPARTGAGAPDGSRVIDLRDDSDLNHETGIARRAR